jgi:hypothetical protein
MFVKAVMTVLCTAGIAFYARFLLALWNECEPRPTGYWVRLDLTSGEDTITELSKRRNPMTRAA